MRAFTCMLLFACLIAFAGCGALPIQNPVPAPILSPMQQAQVWYLEVGRALEEARALIQDWQQAGLIGDEDMILAKIVWEQAQAAMKAWKTVLAIAERQGGLLPANHPVIVMAVYDALGRLHALLTAIAADRRAAPVQPEPSPIGPSLQSV